jgi:hypothetical protein
MNWLFEKAHKTYIIDSQINQYVYSSETINIIYVFNITVKVYIIMKIRIIF